MDNKLLTRSEIAEMFGVTPSTVSNWANQGWIKPIKTSGKVIYFDEESALALIPSIAEIEEAKALIATKKGELRSIQKQIDLELEMLNFYEKEVITNIGMKILTLGGEESFNIEDKRMADIFSSFINRESAINIGKRLDITPLRVTQLFHKSVRVISRQIDKYNAVKEENDTLKETNRNLFMTLEDKKPITYISPKANEFLKKRVLDCEFPTRLKNSILRYPKGGIETVQQLCSKSEYELKRYRDFGKKSLKEVQLILNEYGLSLGQYYQTY